MRKAVAFLTCLALLALARLTIGSIYLSDNQNVAVPADNGTSSNLNISARMQQYAGFYGTINATIILSPANNNTRLYQKPVTQGKIYFVKQGDSPSGEIVPAVNDSQTDANFSLTGFYATGNHFIYNGTVTGVASVDYLNTTDNYMVGLFKDSADPRHFFVGTDIRTVTSTNGMGTVSYEIVTPKTGFYTAYDVFVDLE